jgi:acyl-CoA synthetase (AMP-forming)/AMP-acid ligase II
VCVDPESGGSCEWTAQVAAADAEPPGAPIDPLALAAIAYTSGTTGRPKGAMHSQHNGLLPGAVALRRGTLGPTEVVGNMLPMTIFNLMVLGPLSTLQAGAKLVVLDTRDPVGIARAIRTEQISFFTTVPAVIHDLLTHPEVDPGDLASLTQPRVGGASTPEWFRRLFRERFGRELASSYALTEGPTLVTREDAGEPHLPGSCGRALPHVELTIRDPDDRELPAGEVGEICIGPQRAGPWAGVYRPVLGYWGQPELSAQALRGGRFHTGDLGRVDADGRLYLVERRSELIIRGGSNIYPSEVERVLRLDERVADCAVLGRPHERLGETLVAFVEAARGAEPKPEELLALCRENLARYKIPEQIQLVAALPRGALGKVDRAALRRNLGIA